MNTGRKISGGKYHAVRKTKLYERLKQERHVTIGETKSKKLHIRGGSMKTIMLKSNVVNIASDGKVKKATIVNVEATPQNTFFARQNRLVKGAIIETSLGKARITNRPSQEGNVNAILISK